MIYGNGIVSSFLEAYPKLVWVQPHAVMKLPSECPIILHMPNSYIKWGCASELVQL